ncbi:hypothetical protein AQUCO_59600001v1 [Aquilegia coerulea]|uniref:Uncharacterized protein n=1 Tax=Aquilegia coerulea TaxID=218851 RepID=A0A2G5C0D3_AQUCA|nr:hypothetical protein AQUCO_59600001v1 [Aquilegia coerulea]
MLLNINYEFILEFAEQTIRPFPCMLRFVGPYWSHQFGGIFCPLLIKYSISVHLSALLEWLISRDVNRNLVVSTQHSSDGPHRTEGWSSQFCSVLLILTFANQSGSHKGRLDVCAMHTWALLRWENASH